MSIHDVARDRVGEPTDQRLGVEDLEHQPVRAPLHVATPDSDRSVDHHLPSEHPLGQRLQPPGRTFVQGGELSVLEQRHVGDLRSRRERRRHLERLVERPDAPIGADELHQEGAAAAASGEQQDVRLVALFVSAREIPEQLLRERFRGEGGVAAIGSVHSEFTDRAATSRYMRLNSSYWASSPRAGLARRSASSTTRSRSAAVAQHSFDCPGQTLGIERRDEETAHLVLDELGKAAGVGSDHGRA